jgi:hypothetical protein
MKKLLLTLIVLAGIIGCENQPITAEAEPDTQPIPRLTFSEDYNQGVGTWVCIITDTENNVDYLYAYTTKGVAICPMTKKEPKDEKNHESP